MSPLWKKAFPPGHCILLEQIHRQKDLTFLNILHEIRNGSLSTNSKSILQSKSVNSLEVGSPAHPVLHAHRDSCQYTNQQCINVVDGKFYNFRSIDSGSNINSLDRLVPVPRVLSLKVGCQVMLLRNLNHNLNNGMIGTVVRFSNTGFPVVDFEVNGLTYQFEFKTQLLWEVKYKSKIPSRRLQLPLSLPMGLLSIKVKDKNMTVEP